MYIQHNLQLCLDFPTTVTIGRSQSILYRIIFSNRRKVIKIDFSTIVQATRRGNVRLAISVGDIEYTLFGFQHKKVL